MMAKNRYIDGYYLGASGAMVPTDMAMMTAKAQAYASNTNYLILVNRATCRVGIFNGRLGAWNMSKFWQCAPGAAATPTVSGTFKVQSKGYYFDSGSARCYWYTQFYGNYLFHSVLYNKRNGSLMDGRVGIPLSHGCVRLEIQKCENGFMIISCWNKSCCILEVKKGSLHIGMLPVKRTIKNNKFSVSQPCYGWRYFMLGSVNYSV